MSKKRHILPGFHPSLGWTVTWLSLIVLLPLVALAGKTASGGWEHFWETITDPEVVATYRVSFGISFLAALINGVFGFLAAWIFARYDFPGRRLMEAATDLPFALPTAVAGIALTALYSPNEWIGKYLEPHGIKIAFTPVGVLIAMTFIGFPFVVRAVQPVISELSADVEEAAATLGAGRAKTFLRVILPAILPALLTGFALAFARGVGEYGSVIFISGNMPGLTEIAPLLIVTQLEEYNYAGATAIACIMMAASFGVLLLINLLQALARRRQA